MGVFCVQFLRNDADENEEYLLYMFPRRWKKKKNRYMDKLKGVIVASEGASLAVTGTQIKTITLKESQKNLTERKRSSSAKASLQSNISPREGNQSGGEEDTGGENQASDKDQNDDDDNNDKDEEEQNIQENPSFFSFKSLDSTESPIDSIEEFHYASRIRSRSTQGRYKSTTKETENRLQVSCVNLGGENNNILFALIMSESVTAESGQETANWIVHVINFMCSDIVSMIYDKSQHKALDSLFTNIFRYALNPSSKISNQLNTPFAKSFTGCFEYTHLSFELSHSISEELTYFEAITQKNEETTMDQLHPHDLVGTMLLHRGHLLHSQLHHLQTSCIMDYLRLHNLLERSEGDSEIVFIDSLFLQDPSSSLSSSHSSTSLSSDLDDRRVLQVEPHFSSERKFSPSQTSFNRKNSQSTHDRNRVRHSITRSVWKSFFSDERIASVSDIDALLQPEMSSSDEDSDEFNIEDEVEAVDTLAESDVLLLDKPKENQNLSSKASGTENELSSSSSSNSRKKRKQYILAGLCQANHILCVLLEPIHSDNGHRNPYFLDEVRVCLRRLEQKNIFKKVDQNLEHYSPGIANPNKVSQFRRGKLTSNSKANSFSANPTFQVHTLTDGPVNVLYHYIHHSPIHGVVMFPPESKVVSSIRDAFIQHAELIRQHLLWRKSAHQIPCEHGLRINDTNNFESSVDYWIIGRLDENGEEFYVCYDDTIPQSTIDLAFKLSVSLHV